jgi:hypothetical protein
LRNIYTYVRVDLAASNSVYPTQWPIRLGGL